MAKHRRVAKQQTGAKPAEGKLTPGINAVRAPLPVVTADPRETPPSSRRKLPTLLIACGVALLCITGFVMTTQTDSQANAPTPREDAIAAILADGGLYHADVEGLDHRALVEARISHLTETPDVVVIADRTWQLVQQDLRWGKQVFGAYVNALAPADIERILEQLSAAGKMPEELILGIGPEYLIQADVSSEGEPGPATAMPSGGTFGLQKITQAFGASAKPRPGLMPYDRLLDTLYPDGSVIWSVDRKKEARSQNREKLAARLAESLKQKVKTSSFSQIVATGELIAETKSQGVEVVIVLTPLHPAIYGQIYNRQTAVRLHESIEDLLAMARGLDVVTLGSFEPFAAGCKDADFATLSVPAPACLSRMLDAGFVVGRLDSEQSSR